MAKCKYYRLKKQVSYDNGLNWQDVIPYEYIQGAEYEYHSTDCGYVGNLERWVNSGTTCEGYDKYNLQVKQTSTDGINWVTTEETQLGSLIELNSEDCGYVAPKKLQLTYNDSTEYDINCNESSELTNSEVSGGTNPISAITSAEIGDCVTSISRAFSGCTNMTVCNIPNSVTSISQFAFANCRSLTSIDIPNSVTSIGYQAFTNCSSLTSCTIGSGVTSIGDSSFYGCSGLTSITIPSGVTNIGIYAFQNCSGLTAITIEATTPPTLGTNAFNNTNDSPIYVPCDSVNVYKAAWSGYANRIEAIPNSCHSEVKFQAWYSDNTTYSAECDASSALTSADTRAHSTSHSAMTDAVVGDCVTSIVQAAFRYCSSLTSIDLPNSLTSIGDYDFYQCTSLTSITIPSGVTSIGQAAFAECSGLTSIDIPNSVTNIGESAFYGCSGLTSIDIPNSVTSIGNYVFQYCTSLTSIEIPSGLTSIGTQTFNGCTSLTSITIPNNVTSIGTNAFLHCSGLTSIEIPSGVTTIGDWAFRYCTSLTAITIEATTPPTLGANAFNNTSCPIYVPCESVNTYKNATNWSDYASRIEAIPNSCHSVKFKAWYSDSTTYSAECDASSALTTADTRAHTTAYSAMTSAIIGDCVTSIGLQAFRNCSGLTSIDIPNTVTTIGDRAFQRCISLNSVTIPDSVTSIGLDAFFNCSGLTTCTIGSGVTTIVKYAFGNCRSLTSIDIPNSVASIGSGAFDGCSSLTEIKIYATEPPTLEMGAFDNTNNCPIYVPAASVNTYKHAIYWSDYASRIQAIP